MRKELKMSNPTEMTKTLGGARLGSGNKNDITLHGYNRSTHDLSRAWRSSMTVGTLVPFLVEPGLPGDDFSIDLATVVRTMPAVGRFMEVISYNWMYLCVR